MPRKLKVKIKKIICDQLYINYIKQIIKIYKINNFFIMFKKYIYYHRRNNSLIILNILYNNFYKNI